MNQNVIIDKVLGVPLKNEMGAFHVGAYKIINIYNIVEEIVLLYCGRISEIENVRINSACYTSDLFHCNRCDCHAQLEESIKYFAKEQNGLILYLLNQDGRSSGTVNKLKSLILMDQERISTRKAFEALGLERDMRDYSSAIAVLKDLHINNINLVTNNPEKIRYLSDGGIRVKRRIPSICMKENLEEYMKSKRRDFGHLIEI